MTSRSLLRPPPRRRPAGRIAAFLCILVLALPLGAGPAEAYPCGYADGGRVVSADCPAPAKPKPVEKPGEPNLVSLTLFVVAVVGVLLIPINYSRREPGDPE
ncbi:MAG: hypothetical protein ACRDKU_06800 [Gaiellaceae bacterium]